MLKSKVDINQNEIVRFLRKHGASVVVLNQQKKGCPDLLVGFNNKNYLFEVKNRKGLLTPPQKKFHAEWVGQVDIIYCFEDALQIIG